MQIKKNLGSLQLRLGLFTSLCANDLCLLHGNEVLYVTKESVNIDLEIRHNMYCNFGLCLAVWLCLKVGSENIMLVRLLKIGAKDLTVGKAWFI